MILFVLEISERTQSSNTFSLKFPINQLINDKIIPVPRCLAVEKYNDKIVSYSLIFVLTITGNKIIINNNSIFLISMNRFSYRSVQTKITIYIPD